MRYELYLTEETNAALISILDRIAERFSEAVAERVRKELWNALIIIEGNPSIGLPFGTIYRKFIVKKTVSLYKVVENKIFIVDAFDTREDWAKTF